MLSMCYIYSMKLILFHGIPEPRGQDNSPSDGERYYTHDCGTLNSGGIARDPP